MIEEAALSSFCSFDFADAHISTIIGTRGALRIIVVDWRETIYHFDFADVAGYEVISAEGQDLSHGSIIIDEPFQLRLDNSVGTCVRSLPCFALWSAWDDSVVLRVVAATVAITAAEAPPACPP
jgi:hypothetical protein